MAFLHGVETVEYLKGASVIAQVRTSVIFLVGTAPIHLLSDPSLASVNELVLVTNETEDRATFGPDRDGYTIPQALAAIRAGAKSNALVIVVNVFDPTVHVNGTTPDPTRITESDIIGTLTESGRTGLQLAQDGRTHFGFDGKILIAPVYGCQATVWAAMALMAERVRGVALVDVPIGATPTQIIAGRSGASGTLNLTWANSRLIPFYPYLKCADPVHGGTRLEPYSQRAAGMMAACDENRGVWWSLSNQEIPGIVGLERSLTARLNDKTCEVNLINSVGVVTVFASYGMGFLTWGNRSSLYPGQTTPDTFYCIRRMADCIEESIEKASMRFMDGPLTRARIDSILDEVNAYFRLLQSEGAILDGRVFFDPLKNPSSELANGHGVIGYRFMPPPPLERLTFEATLDINLASAIVGGGSQ